MIGADGYNAGAVARLRSLPDVVAEYDAKLKAIPEAVAAFEAAGAALKTAASVGGEYGQETIDVGHVYAKTLEKNLLRSAWVHVWKGLNLPAIASAKDKKAWEQAMAAPPDFTLDNLRATFGPYLENPRATILRGLAEVFSDLDPAYKSHEKVKIGVKGLPKRLILGGINSYGGGWGWDKVRDILNALAAYQGKPLPTGEEMAALREDGEALRVSKEVPDPYESHHVHRRRAEAGEPPKTVRTVGRGVWLKRFQNGNAHVFFDPEALTDINRALAEFYGDVLPDSPEAWAEERPAKRASTEVARDLQFYGTPAKVIDRLIGLATHSNPAGLKGLRVLEPSCGDGRIMDEARKLGADVWGIEVDAGRAAQTRAKGHRIFCSNFLEAVGPNRPEYHFDLVLMNPPFYGRHYAKHVRHAIRFLKPGGKLCAILPATARYDHGELDDLDPDWTDLPVGAFAESGTNVCTTIAIIRKPKEASRV